MSWAITILSLIGVIANIYKKKWCFMIWVFTNGFWCIWDFKHGLYSQSALFLVYFCLSIWGLIKWSRDDSVK
jgi:hypothetical protein